MFTEVRGDQCLQTWTAYYMKLHFLFVSVLADEINWSGVV